MNYIANAFIALAMLAAFLGAAALIIKIESWIQKARGKEGKLSPFGIVCGVALFVAFVLVFGSGAEWEPIRR